MHPKTIPTVSVVGSRGGGTVTGTDPVSLEGRPSIDRPYVTGPLHHRHRDGEPSLVLSYRLEFVSDVSRTTGTRTRPMSPVTSRKRVKPRKLDPRMVYGGFPTTGYVILITKGRGPTSGGDRTDGVFGEPKTVQPSRPSYRSFETKMFRVCPT